MNLNENLIFLRHSCSHLLAAAVLKLYPDAKLTLGPAIETGFYYDIDFSSSISDAELPKIEKKMYQIVASWKSFDKREVDEQEALAYYKNNPYKQELIKEHHKKDETLTFYTAGEFTDLCAGGHIENPSKDLKHFKLLTIAGAYWRGDEKNKMLTRIYGTAFFTKEELDKYLWQLQEAKKRDHRKLGTILNLWTYSDLVGSGLPLFTPKGALVRRLINQFVEDLQSKQGITQVWTPQIAKAELFKISGHYDKYKENLFQVKSNYSDEEFFLKPMNCPQHTQIYASQQRSYKDLPIRLADFAMLYRDEKPGELLGLIRTRSFSQDDCHIFCTEDQIVDEMNKALDMTATIMKTYGFSYKYRLSVRDPQHKDKYLGDDATWEKSESICEGILKTRKIDYYIGIGEAAFYAPKLDLIAVDSIGRQWQLSTLQVDFFMPNRFKLTYIDNKGNEKTPVMLHRAISGSPERLMAILIEHYAGELPLWISPVQVVILPISERFIEYANNIKNLLEKTNIRVELDNSNQTIGAKIRNSTLQKIPYMVIIGEKEKQSYKIDKVYNVSVRTRQGTDLGLIELNKFIDSLKQQIENKTNSI